MKWDAQKEFAVVIDLLASASRSKGVDAFALSLLKAERHARRVFTFLIFQSNCFEEQHIPELRAALVKHEYFAFTSALAGIDLISPYSLIELCGDHHAALLSLLPTIKKRRNKIFHGQLTNESLSMEELASTAMTLRNWSVALAENGASKLGYDGFTSRSFVKHSNTEFSRTLKRQLTSVADYSAFIAESHKASQNQRTASAEFSC